MIFPTLPDFDHHTAGLARLRQQQLTKPAGALGALETLSIQLAGITGNARPTFRKPGVIIMAADHGVVLEGVSAYPAEVTPQMVFNFLRGGAAVNVLARQAGASVTVVDVGIAYDFNGSGGLIHHKIAPGTQNILKGPAMTKRQAEEAVQVGIEIARAEIDAGLDLVATGEMGIGNTTPSSAIAAVMTGLPVETVTGRGTGVDDDGLQRKIQVIREAIEVNQPDPRAPFDVLVKLGGLEIAGLVGVIIGAASCRVPVVIDGFISGAAALIAAEMLPGVKPFLIASHQSEEIGHAVILQRMNLRPLLNLGMRLGEGTGAVLAFHLIQAAAGILNEMATFSEAGISDKE